ncbi:MAG: mandelate racemase/muconate lactonizing enzyme family protein [Pseudomonadota bacterium]
MKIAAVDVFVLKTPLETPFAFSQGWVRQRSATLVRITGSEGHIGWGEAFAQGLEPPEIASAAIEHAFKPALLGADPLKPAVLWQQMYAKSRDYGRKGSVMAAISAIDIALWDLCGQVYQQPIHRLLGGAHRMSVRPYATGFYRVEGKGEAERLAEEARHHKAAGFTAMKVKLGFGLDDDFEVMHAVAKALADPSIELMVDTNHAYGRAEALRLGRELEQFNMRWYEEPVVPEDVEGYSELRSKLSVPIAGGENEHSPFGFYPLIKAGGIDVAQPDIGSCGGVTAARDIAALAHAAGVAVNPHVWGSSVAQAASLQFIATLPAPHHSIFAKEPVLEYDRSDHPFRQHLIKEPWMMEDGLIAIPNGPGLGVEVNMETVERYQT